jgi:hypothetical protein
MFNSVCGTFFRGRDQITEMYEGGSPILYVDFKEMSESLQKRCDRLEQDNSKYYWDSHFKDCALKSARLAEEKAISDLQYERVRNCEQRAEMSCLNMENEFLTELLEGEIHNREEMETGADNLIKENFELRMQLSDLKQKNAFLDESIRLILAEQKEEIESVEGENNALHQKVNALEQTVKDLRDKMESLTKIRA